jgi:Zn-dependent alcohol dehydrogenase
VHVQRCCTDPARTQIPRLLNLYRDGTVKLDELITETYPLDKVSQGVRGH